MKLHSARCVRLFGFDVRAESLPGAVDAITKVVREGGPVIHVVLNAAKVSRASQDKEFGRLLAKFDMIHADGASIVLAGRILGRPVPERVAGIDLMLRLLGSCVSNGFRPYFLGAKQHVLESFIEQVYRQYPGIEVAGYRNGYWKEEEEAKVIAGIRQASPDMLFVGVPTPKKETFLVRHREALRVPFSMGVGGAFDVVAGFVKRAPIAWQKAGMEWAFRLLQEPRRMWRRYLVTNTHFAWLLAAEFVRIRLLGKDV